MKVKRFILLFLSFSVLLTFSVSLTAAAPTFFSRYRHANGISNIKYYVSVNWKMSDSFASAFEEGAETWGSNKISISQTTTYWDGHIDCYVDYLPNNLNPGTLGWTYYWVPKGDTNELHETVNNINANWIGAECYVNYEITLTGTDLRGVASHEVGHAFGLNENNSDQSSIMCQYGAGRYVTLPSTADKNAVGNGY